VVAAIVAFRAAAPARVLADRAPAGLAASASATVRRNPAFGFVLVSASGFVFCAFGFGDGGSGLYLVAVGDVFDGADFPGFVVAFVRDTAGAAGAFGAGLAVRVTPMDVRKLPKRGTDTA
jgi:hypothetical protein